MNNIKKEIVRYFENYLGGVPNKYDVEIRMIDDNYYSAASDVPGFEHKEEYCISLSVIFDSIDKLIKTFLIDKVSDLENVTPELLYRLYENQEASIFCMINDSDSFGLFFRKMGSTLFATDACEENTHAVVPFLQTQEAFYNYTVHFYENVYKKQY